MRCRYCKDKFVVKYFLQKYCMEKDECIKAFRIEGKTKEIDNKVKVMEFDITDWRAKLQTKLQEIARLIDNGQPCLARGVHSKQVHGGHIFAKGGNSSMALNLHNIHRQSAQSNHFQNDDGLLREGLAKEYGKAYMEFVSNLRRTPQLMYSNDEYHEFYFKANNIAKDMKKHMTTCDMMDRIESRNNINNELGIYPLEYCNFNEY